SPRAAADLYLAEIRSRAGFSRTAEIPRILARQYRGQTALGQRQAEQSHRRQPPPLFQASADDALAKLRPLLPNFCAGRVRVITKKSGVASASPRCHVLGMSLSNAVAEPSA